MQNTETGMTRTGVVTMTEDQKDQVLEIMSQADALVFSARNLHRHIATLHLASQVPAAPALETPDELAMRLMGDPETLAAVIIAVARRSSANDRQALHDEIDRQEARYRATSASLRLLAATIAAGSFGK